MNKLTNKLPFITTKWFDIDVGLFYPELLYDKTIEVLSISFMKKWLRNNSCLQIRFLGNF